MWGIRLAKQKTFLEEVESTVIEKLKKADLKEIGRFVVEEALYIALMSDLFLVSGRMKVFKEDGVTWTPLYAQRQVIANMIIAMKDMAWQDLPLTDLKPLGWAHPLLSSWETALQTFEDVDGTVYATALPNHMRMFMVLGLPGMLRIAVQLTRQLVQIAT